MGTTSDLDIIVVFSNMLFLILRRMRLLLNPRPHGFRTRVVRIYDGLSIKVVFDGSDDADGFSQAGVGRTNASVFAWFAGVTALIGRKNSKNALIGLANASNFGAGIGGEAASGCASVARGFGDHVGLDGIEPREFVGDALALSGIAVEHDTLLYELHGFLCSGSHLIDTRSAYGDLLLDDVAMRSPLTATKFVGLRIHHADHAELNFGRLDALLGEKLLDGIFIRFGSGIDGGKIVAGFLGADGPNGKIRFHLAFDEAFDGDITIVQTRGFDLGAENPCAKYDSEPEKETERCSTAVG